MLGQQNGATGVHEASAKTEPARSRPPNRQRSPAPHPCDRLDRAAFANLLQLATGDKATATIPLFAALAGLAFTADPDKPELAARLRGALAKLRHDAVRAPRDERY